MTVAPEFLPSPNVRLSPAADSSSTTIAGRSPVKTTLFGMTLVAAVSLCAANSARAENAMYSCTDANGVVALTNVPTGPSCQQLFEYSAPTPAPQPTAAVAQLGVAPAHVVAEVGANAPASNAAPVKRAQPKASTKDRLAQRRNDAIQQTRDALASGQPVAGLNPAVNRRYLMTNRADYQRVNGVVPQ